MYKPRRLQFSWKCSKEFIKFDIQLWGTATIITGNSGTGKTLLCRGLSQPDIKQWYTKTFGGGLYFFSNYNCESCGVFLKDSVLTGSVTDSLVVMDDAANYMTSEYYNTIVADPTNYYIVITRALYGITLSPNYFAEMYQKKDGVYSLKYKYTQKAWY